MMVWYVKVDGKVEVTYAQRRFAEAAYERLCSGRFKNSVALYHDAEKTPTKWMRIADPDRK